MALSGSPPMPVNYGLYADLTAFEGHALLYRYESDGINQKAQKKALERLFLLLLSAYVSCHAALHRRRGCSQAAWLESLVQRRQGQG